MSKLQLEIPIKNLPKKVLKELLELCDDNSLRNKINISKPSCKVKIELMYDYNEDFSQSQQESIVFHASDIDVKKEINSRKINEHDNQ